MTDLELIAQLDKRIEIINKRWSDEVAEVLADKKIAKDKERQKYLLDLISQHYGDLLAEVLLLREETYNREYERQQQDFDQSFEKKPTEKTLSATKIRKNGQWVDREGQEE